MSEKLVRDKIPEIIESSGRACHYRIASDDEYKHLLIEKLDEEVTEYKESGSLEELADILEVLIALSNINNCSESDLLYFNHKKREERGGFDNKIVLMMD